MLTKFVEASQAIDGTGFNWGKFSVARFEPEEWRRRSLLPGCEGEPLLGGRGWDYNGHAFVTDLQTGEGAFFRLGGLASADLNKRKIWVCVLFEGFLTWLYQHHTDNPRVWFEAMPQLVALPDVEPDMAGYRRPGPDADRRAAVDAGLLHRTGPQRLRAVS